DSPTARFQELAFLDMGLFNVCLRRLEASPPKPRRLAQIKKLMRKPWSGSAIKKIVFLLF
ncbi:MAG: hypothetical protein IKO75_01480, partial [Bacteroidales bacterium]|nr:hypothetical protein [Bacteroidales bacterium]